MNKYHRAVLSLALVVSSITAFLPTAFVSQQQLVQTSSKLWAAKGFGAKTTKVEKSEGQVKREQQSDRYDEIARLGGQEYKVYVRQFGSDDKSWLPCGSIAVPRASQVSDAIYSNVDALKSAIVRTYPKLKGFEDEFEFGFNLKVYPDDPIEVAVKTSRDAGISVGNWISNLLSPIDASKTPTPPPSDGSSS